MSASAAIERSVVVRKAAHVFESNRASYGPMPVVILEGAYIDPRETDGRPQHLQDSFDLLDQLRASQKQQHPQFLLASLDNDFPSQSPLCGFESCSTVRESPSGRMPRWADRIYEQRRKNTGSLPLRQFSMRNARNRASATLRRQIAAKSPKIVQQVDADIVDIYAQGSGGSVYLGARHRKANAGITIRCSALMAQHYFDLYKFALEKFPGVSSLIIYDFNLYTERDRVRMGAEASFALYPWSENVPAYVINCIYFPSPAVGSPVHVTSSLD